MSRVLLSVALVLLVGSLMGCGGGGGEEGQLPAIDTAAAPTASYWPLARGFKWRYRFVTYGEDAGVQIQVLKITNLGTIEGLKWFTAQSWTGGKLDSTQYQYRHSAGGMLCRSSLVADPYYLIRTPLQAGTSWQMLPGITRTIDNASAATTVPAGLIRNCLLVRQTYSAPSMSGTVVRYWYARDFGLVRWEIREDGVLTNQCGLINCDVTR